MVYYGGGGMEAPMDPMASDLDLRSLPSVVVQAAASLGAPCHFVDAEDGLTARQAGEHFLNSAGAVETDVPDDAPDIDGNVTADDGTTLQQASHAGDVLSNSALLKYAWME